MNQPALSLTVRMPRSPMVTVEMVRSLEGVDADTVHGWIQDGTLARAWDISIQRGTVAEYRIWARSMLAHGDDRLSDQQVLDAVIGYPTEKRLRAVTVSNMMVISRAHVMRLVEAGELAGPMAGHTQWIERKSLENFLRRRAL